MTASLDENLFASAIEVFTQGLVLIAARRFKWPEGWMLAGIGLGGAIGLAVRLGLATNDVHVWVAILHFGVIAAAAAAWGHVLYRSWREAPRAAHASVSDPASAPPKHPVTPEGTAPSGVIVHTQLGPRALRGIGTISLVTIQYEPIPGGGRGFRCMCVVTFYRFAEFARTSPSELRLMCRGGGNELATLKGTMLECPNTVIYQGVGNWESLMTYIQRTMRVDLSGQIPWSNDIERQVKLFCEVEIHLPDGGPGEMHRSSGVAMEFELSTPGHRGLVVEVLRMADAAQKLGSNPIS